MPSVPFDADLYLQRLRSGTLHGQVESALRLSLDCFRKELFVPCVAMLGAASEGAWVDLGEALGKKYSGDRHAGQLLSALGDQQHSTKAKIQKVCHFYERPVCAALCIRSGVSTKRLRTVEQWSDQVRESRNVLHWGAQASVPNSYEKVAVLLMDAVAELNTLLDVKKAL